MGSRIEGQVEQLEKSYVEYHVPSDRLLKDTASLDRFARRFNSGLGGNAEFDSFEAANQLLTLRKGAKLPRIRH
jgi:hypothetical protein